MSLSVDLEKFAGRAEESTDRFRRAVIMELFGSVVRDTPVLTGRLRSNWQTSVGAPALGTVEPRGGTAPNVVPSEIMTEIMAASGESRGKDVPVYLRNNLPYAERIEFDGWSHTKAPAGMMRKNVARIGRIIAAKGREFGK